MRMLSFVEKLVQVTLPLLLKDTLRGLLMDLERPEYRRRIVRRLQVDYPELPLVQVLVRERLEDLSEDGTYGSGVPPPLRAYHHDDGRITFYDPSPKQ